MVHLIFVHQYYHILRKDVCWNMFCRKFNTSTNHLNKRCRLTRKQRSKGQRTLLQREPSVEKHPLQDMPKTSKPSQSFVSHTEAKHNTLKSIISFSSLDEQPPAIKPVHLKSARSDKTSCERVNSFGTFGAFQMMKTTTKKQQVV